MTTAITQWGNSSGVRIPAKVLGRSRFKLGDVVDFVVNQHGNIEIVAPAEEHRAVRTPGRVTSEDLYRRFPACVEESSGAASTATAAWPSDDLVGAEWDSWSN